MINKIIILLLALISGFSTISIFSNIDFDEGLSFAMAELIMNPIRYFTGMFTFIVSTLALATFIRAAIEQTVHFVRKKQALPILLAVDYSAFACYFLLMIKSVWITVMLITFSLMFGIITIDIHNEAIEDRDS